MEEIKFLFLTILAELPVALVFLRKEDRRRVILAVLGVNMISHPAVWELLYSYNINWLMAETGVMLFEAVVFFIIFSKRRSAAAAAGVCMNIFTAAIAYFFF